MWEERKRATVDSAIEKCGYNSAKKQPKKCVSVIDWCGWNCTPEESGYIEKRVGREG